VARTGTVETCVCRTAEGDQVERVPSGQTGTVETCVCRTAQGDQVERVPGGQDRYCKNLCM
jgi:hypothetical protein